MATLIRQQQESTDLIIQNNIRTIFVDGGFSKNIIFMKMLAAAYPTHNVYSADLHEASSLGAALAIHEAWNTKTKPDKLISVEHVRA
jgi:sugar (pentulose or hexulose) kinase